MGMEQKLGWKESTTSARTKLEQKCPLILSLSLLLSALLALPGAESSSLFHHTGLGVPSEKFQFCRFNTMCYCKYSLSTELYDTLATLWHHSSFNETLFLKTVHKEFPTKRGESQVQQFHDQLDLNSMVDSIVNRSNVKFDPGPVFEFFCLNVPLAVVPSDYSPNSVLSHVSLVGSKLTVLDGSSFAGVEIQSLVLNRNELYSISEYAFSSMSTSISVLDLANNELAEIPFTAFKTLKLLEWLNLSHNKIQSVEGDWLGIKSSLRQLTISGNSIEYLPPRLFSTFPRLIWLDISSNSIRNLSQHNLPPNLQTLIMMKNPVSVFPLGIFALRSLSWVVLSGCRIEQIPSDWPRAISPIQINQMDIQMNFIQHWPRRPFSGQLKILDLDLSKNYIELLPSFAFHAISAFRISLGQNRIQTIDPQAFESLSETLQYLNLDHNRLKSVPWESLVNLTSLKHLYIGNNEGIGDSSLEKIPDTYDCTLNYLGLNANGLTRLPERILKQCQNLIHLNLGYNQIGSLDLFATRKFRTLSTLILRNNPIHSISFYDENKISPLGDLAKPQQPSPTLPSASVLNPNEVAVVGESNQIPNIFRPESFPRLYELSLSFCELSGELPPFSSLPLTNLEISNGLKSAAKISSETFQRLTSLQWTALDHNQIFSISDYAFYANKNISYVSLEFNRIANLPRQLFHPDIHASIRELRLAHNKIQTIHTDSFLSLPANHLDLSYNLIHTVERHAFTIAPQTSHGANLVSKYIAKSDGLHAYFRHNKINLIKNAAFSQEKFALVDLSYNSLTHFHFDSFGKRTLVGGCNISHNMLEKVTSHGTRRMLIKFLDLSHNRLEYSGVQIRDVCPTELLDLSFNRIERVDESLFPTNCSIKEVHLSHNQIARLDPDAFSQLGELTVLHLNGNQISYVPEILFIRNHKLLYLDLSRNKIRSLPRDSLVGSNIEVLFLSNNDLSSFPMGALSQISRRLKRLDVSINYLEHLDSTMFESVPGLVHLNLSSNRINILADNVFANLGSLRELDLSHNHLRANFKELFHFLPKLKLLRLSNCGLTSVLPHLPLPHLLSLDLSMNRGLSEINIQSLTSLNRLRELDITNCALTNSRLPNWAPLQSLVSLKLSRNPLRSLTRDTFSGLNRLETLELLDLDRVDRFDSDVLSNLMNLKRLSVETYPNIEKYRFRLGAVLSGIEGLEELHVKIKESILTDQVFGGILPSMRKLTVTGSGLKRIEDQAFEGLQNCRRMELSITHTSVEEIPPRVFELLTNAEWAQINLSFNKLSSLNSASLYPNSSLWFSKGTKILAGGLILDGNEWVCDCNLVWVGDWLRRNILENLEPHSVSVPEVHSMYSVISRPTCLDSRTGANIPIVQLYPDHICHASALSSGPSFTAISTLTLIIIIPFLQLLLS